MRQLIRARRGKEPHLSYRSCLREVTFTGSSRAGWSRGVGNPGVCVRVKQGAHGAEDRLEAPSACAGYGGEARTWAKGLTSSGCALPPTPGGLGQAAGPLHASVYASVTQTTARPRAVVQLQ